MTLGNDGGILIFGGTGGTGLEIAKILAAGGEAVTVVARLTSDLSGLEGLDVNIVTGDVLDADSVEAAFATGKFRAVVNTVGGRRGEPRPDVIGGRNIVDAALRAGVARNLMVTAIGAGDSRTAVAPKVIEVLGEVLAAKAEAEDYLMQSGLDATILRPGGMTSDPASGTAIKSEDHTLMGVIHRADLAQLTVDCIDDAATIGRIYHTVDPEITWQAPLQRGEELGDKK